MDNVQTDIACKNKNEFTKNGNNKYNMGSDKLYYVNLDDINGESRTSVVKHANEQGSFVKKMRLTSSTPVFIKSDIKRNLSEVKVSVKNGKFESTNKVK